MRRAFLVVGPESSGTRLMTGILVDAGCFGDKGHHQRLDNRDLALSPDLVVWRRSVPHAGRNPPIPEMLEGLSAVGYEAQLIVMVRDRHALACSQVRRGHAMGVPNAYQQIEAAYRWIFGAASACPCAVFVVPYESLALHPESAATLLAAWGLETHTPQVFDGNAPYYEVTYGCT